MVPACVTLYAMHLGFAQIPKPADAPAPLTPEQSAAAFKLPDGFRMDVVASEPHPTRQALAEQLGAVVVAPDELGKPAMPFDLVDDPFDAVLECSGHAAAMQAGLSQLKRGGTLVLVGAGMDWPRFDNNRITLNELVITGAFVYDPDGFPRALELLASPDFPTDVLIESDDVPLEGLYDAVERLVSGELPAKVMIAPSRGNGGEG